MEETHRFGCLCCPGTEDVLSKDTVLYNGFGGYRVRKNGKPFYQAEVNSEYDDCKKLSDIELLASEDPDAVYEVILDLPLRGATWVRSKDGEYRLKDTNQGFA